MPTTSLVPNPVYGDEDWYAVYFTSPEEDEAQNLRNGPDQYLADAIRLARVSVDVAVLRLDLWSVRDALIAAHRRGVSVRLVTDDQYFDEPEVQALVDSGIPVVQDGNNGLMHHKFAVIDRQDVWSGSMNMTIGDSYYNNNNLLHIHSAPLAENFAREFEEMVLDHQFGPDSTTDTPHPVLVIQGSQLENYFSPDDGVADRLEDLIYEAQESIFFLAYSFTSSELAAALIARHSDGLTVSGVMEASQVESNLGSQYQHFVTAGVDVRLDGNPQSMHHKVMVIDRQIVVAGSYNFTVSAEKRNDENILIIKNPQLAQAFLEEYETIFAQAQK